MEGEVRGGGRGEEGVKGEVRGWREGRGRGRGVGWREELNRLTNWWY